MESVTEIDNRLSGIEAQISRLVDVEALKAQLSTPTNQVLNARELGQLQARDTEITDQIAQLQELWIITTLKKEIEINLELFEFETVFSSLDKLNQKINAISLNTPIVKTKWIERASVLHDIAIEKFIEAWKKLVVEESQDECSSLTFNESIDIDDFPVMYESFEEVIQQYSLPQNILNISHTIDSFFMTKLFTGGYALVLEGNTLSCTRQASSTKSELIKSYASSIKSLVSFVNLIPTPTRIINYISPRLYEKLQELITDYADLIYNDQGLKQTFTELGDHLQSHGFRRNNLKQWITDDLHGFTVEHYLNEHIEKLRELFETPNFTLISRTLPHTAPHEQHHQQQQQQHLQHSQPKPQTAQARAKPKSKLSVAKSDDEWDSWGNEDEEVDEEHNEKNTEPTEEGPDHTAHTDDDDDDDGWGAWGEDDEDDDDDVKEVVKEKAKPHSNKLVSKLSHKSRSPTPVTPQKIQSTLSTSTYQITAIPEKAKDVIESYIATSHHLPKEYHEQHLGKVSYLATTYFMLGSVTYPSKLLLYNDIAYLDKLHPLPELREINDRLLLNFIKEHEADIESHYAQLNGLDPSITAGRTMHLLEEIQKSFDVMFKDLALLEKQTFMKIVVSVIGEFYQMVFDSVMNKGDIGEQESQYLSQLIGKFLSLRQPLGEEIKVVKNWHKLEKTSFILNGHLKDIMERFYRADFYEFETGELIALIDKLFAESDLKRSYIEEIREIRTITE